LDLLNLGVIFTLIFCICAPILLSLNLLLTLFINIFHQHFFPAERVPSVVRNETDSDAHSGPWWDTERALGLFWQSILDDYGKHNRSREKNMPPSASGYAWQTQG
jgi:hypothetical protein